MRTFIEMHRAALTSGPDELPIAQCVDGLADLRTAHVVRFIIGALLEVAFAGLSTSWIDGCRMQVRLLIFRLDGRGIGTHARRRDGTALRSKEGGRCGLLPVIHASDLLRTISVTGRSVFVTPSGDGLSDVKSASWSSGITQVIHGLL